MYQVHFTVSCLKDLTATTEIKASSRQAMIGSLSGKLFALKIAVGLESTIIVILLYLYATVYLGN